MFSVYLSIIEVSIYSCCGQMNKKILVLHSSEKSLQLLISKGSKHLLDISKKESSAIIKLLLGCFTARVSGGSLWVCQEMQFYITRNCFKNSYILFLSQWICQVILCRTENLLYSHQRSYQHVGLPIKAFNSNMDLLRAEIQAL